MSTRAPSFEPRAVRARRVGALAARLAGPIGVAALALLGGALMSRPADAATQLCGDRDQLLKSLQQRHEETPQALGLSADGGVLEVLVSPRGGWTMLITYPRRPTCVVAVGEAWQMLKFTGGQPA